jgi:hypothetical protein
VHGTAAGKTGGYAGGERMIYFAYGSGIFAGLMVCALACELVAGWVIRQIGGERIE